MGNACLDPKSTLSYWVLQPLVTGLPRLTAHSSQPHRDCRCTIYSKNCLGSVLISKQADISIALLVAVCYTHTPGTTPADAPRYTCLEVFWALMKLFIHQHKSLTCSSVITRAFSLSKFLLWSIVVLKFSKSFSYKAKDAMNTTGCSKITPVWKWGFQWGCSQAVHITPHTWETDTMPISVFSLAIWERKQGLFGFIN